jgi:Zn-dependent M32 family carboxypeptidase
MNGHKAARQVKRKAVRSTEMPMNLTNEIHEFREATWHLWNTYLKREANFDSIDNYLAICMQMFEEQLINRLGLCNC